MERKQIYITKQQIDRLKKLSKETGLSVSELIRRSIDRYENS